MRRTGTLTLTTATVEWTIEAFGKIKHDDPDNFAEWVDHQHSRIASLVAGNLSSLLKQANPDKTASRTDWSQTYTGRSDMTLQGTHVNLTVTIKGASQVSYSLRAEIVEVLLSAMREHVIKHLEPEDTISTMAESLGSLAAVLMGSLMGDKSSSGKMSIEDFLGSDDASFPPSTYPFGPNPGRSGGRSPYFG